MLYSEINNLTELSTSYLITGEDSFLMQQSLNEILKKCNVQTSDLDCEIFDQENLTGEKFYASASQMPFMCAKRIVVVKNITNLLENTKKTILSYLSNPNPMACVLFIDTYNNKIFAFLEKVATLIECKKPSLFECEKFCNLLLEKHNKKIDRNALALLCELTNYNLNSIQNELTKLCFYTCENITYELVEKFVSKTLDYQVYEFTNALSKKQTDRAIELLNDMIARKETNGLIPLIANNFRRMFFASINDNLEETANMLKVKPYALTKAKEQAKNFSPKKLKDINYLLEEIDYKVKSGEMLLINALYYLVFELCK